jgi:hypothetical protein
VDSFLNPAHDPTLLALKQIAEAGGERGPLYDEGVLSVVRQVEAQEHFVRNPICGPLTAMQLQQQTQANILTPDELDQGRRFLEARGWTLDQSFQYVCGVKDAENHLAHLRREDDQ